MRLLIAALSGLAALASPVVLAQTPNSTWQRVVSVEGDRGEIDSMAITADGNIVVGGTVTRPVDFNQGEALDAWLAMYTPDGNQLWSRQFGGVYRDSIADLAIDRDGSIIVTGSRDMVSRPGNDSVNTFAARFAASGELIWDRIIAADGRRMHTSEIVIAHDGSILLSGQDTPGNEGGSRPLVIMLAASGDVNWISTPPAPSLEESPKGSVVVSKASGQSFAFDSAQTLASNAERIEVAILRTTWAAQGEPATCVVLDPSNGNSTDAICSDASLNGFREGKAFSGGRTANYPQADPVIRKLGRGGSFAWTRVLASPEGDGLFDTTSTPDGGVVGAGFQLIGNRVDRHNWDGLLVRLDADGNELWRRTFGGNKREELKAVSVLGDGSIIVAGFTGSQTGVQDWAPWIMRLNPEGELEGEALKEMQDRQF